MFRTAIRSILLVCASGLCALPVLAEGANAKMQSPAAAPRPARELSQLKFFEGDWTCTGRAFASPMESEHPTRATVHIKNQLAGFWYHVHYQEQKTKDNPTPYEVMALWGYDSSAGQFVAGSVDSMGGYGKSTSTGWSNDNLVFTGEMNGGGKKTPSRDTFTKKPNGDLVHIGEYNFAEGQWTKTDEETCKKAGKR